jgi:hypothetical protein
VRTSAPPDVSDTPVISVLKSTGGELPTRKFSGMIPFELICLSHAWKAESSANRSPMDLRSVASAPPTGRRETGSANSLASAPWRSRISLNSFDSAISAVIVSSSLFQSLTCSFCSAEGSSSPIWFQNVFTFLRSSFCRLILSLNVMLASLGGDHRGARDRA